MTGRLVVYGACLAVMAGLGTWLGWSVIPSASHAEPTTVTPFAVEQFRPIPRISHDGQERLRLIHDLSRIPSSLEEEDVRVILEFTADDVFTPSAAPLTAADRERAIITRVACQDLAARLREGLPVSEAAKRLIRERAAWFATHDDPNRRVFGFHLLRDGGFYETPEGKALVDEMIRTEKDETVLHAMVGNMERYDALKRHAAWGKAKGGSKGGG